jgi:hypothetical protein
MAVWFGNLHPMFMDQTFPTVLGLVVVPTLFFTLSLHSLDTVKLTLKAVIGKEANAKAQYVLTSVGKIALLNGFIVTLINLMSIGYHWHDSPSASYLGAAFATAIMSSVIGLVINLFCLVGFYRVKKG